MTLSFSLFLSDEEHPKRFAAEAPITNTLVINEPPPQEVDPAAKLKKLRRSLLRR
jgi:hypothetical protein